MTLIERSERLIKRLDAFQKNKSLATQSKQFATRAEQLKDAAAALQHIVIMQEALAANAITADADDKSLTQLGNRAITLHNAFTLDPESIVRPDPPLASSFLNPLTKEISTIEGRLMEVWRSEVQSTLGSMPDGLLGAIENIRKLAPQVRRLRELQNSGKRIADIFPTPDAVAVKQRLEEVCDLATRKSQILETLEGIPKEVVLFLHLAANSEARISHVTPSVREWIEREGLMNEFRVKTS